METMVDDNFGGAGVACPSEEAMAAQHATQEAQTLSPTRRCNCTADIAVRTGGTIIGAVLCGGAIGTRFGSTAFVVGALLGAVIGIAVSVWDAASRNDTV